MVSVFSWMDDVSEDMRVDAGEFENSGVETLDEPEEVDIVGAIRRWAWRA